MMDQAYKLRELVKQQNEEADITPDKDVPAPKTVMTARMITISSGKGGVGKSNFTVNLAIHLRKQNKRVIIIDADFGLANVEVLYGIIPKYNAGNVLTGQIGMENALTVGPLGVMFLSGGSGLTALSDISEEQMSLLIEGFAQLDEMADIILIDTGAGMSKSVLNFIRATQETIVVTTPDPTSITDAYALIKTIKEGVGGLPEIKLLVNRIDDPNEGIEIYDKLNAVCERFLGIKLENLGSVPYDKLLGRSVKKQSPVSILYPDAESAKSIEAVTRRLLDIPPVEKKTNIRSFLSKLLGRKG
jgi:flagellar biosynthesis protein FlhG